MQIVKIHLYTVDFYSLHTQSVTKGLLATTVEKDSRQDMKALSQQADLFCSEFLPSCCNRGDDWWIADCRESVGGYSLFHYQDVQHCKGILD